MNGPMLACSGKMILVGHATCNNTMTLSTGQILAASFVAATIASAELVGDIY